jgi:hypothetical protein
MEQPFLQNINHAQNWLVDFPINLPEITGSVMRMPIIKGLSIS